MATQTSETYAAAGALQTRETWSNGTQQGNPAAGYVKTDGLGAVLTQRALTANEATWLAGMDANSTSTTNTATIQANIQTHIAQLESWLTANPNGAILTAAQTKFVAQTLVGVGRLLLGLTSTVGGAT